MLKKARHQALRTTQTIIGTIIILAVGAYLLHTMEIRYDPFGAGHLYHKGEHLCCKQP